MDVRPSFIADRQAAIPIEPRERPFHHPAIPSQPLAGRDAPARQANPDVVGLVDMHLRRALPAMSGRRADQGLEQHAVVPVRPGEQAGQGNPLLIDDQVPIRARSGAIGRTGSHAVAPFLPGCSRRPLSRGPTRYARPPPTHPGASGATGPRHPPPASPATSASTSCRTHSPSPQVDTPRLCLQCGS